MIFRSKGLVLDSFCQYLPGIDTKVSVVAPAASRKLAEMEVVIQWTRKNGSKSEFEDCHHLNAGMTCLYNFGLLCSLRRLYMYRNIQWESSKHRLTIGLYLCTEAHMACVDVLIHMHARAHIFEQMIEGSLEAKLPTIWKDGNGTARKKLGRGES